MTETKYKIRKKLYNYKPLIEGPSALTEFLRMVGERR